MIESGPPSVTDVDTAHGHKNTLIRVHNSHSMFYGMSRKNCGVGRRQQSARQLRHSLQWLPVRARTDFKLATLSYKSRMTGQLDNLAAELRCYQPQLSLRSSSQELLTVAYLTVEQC